MGAYLHGYLPEEQRRLVDQAARWREPLILRDTAFAFGSQLLEVGCGVGAVLGVLGQAFPGLALHGVDFSAAQLGFAEKHLSTLGLQAELKQADALSLPYPSGRFDAIWMMWFLEHVSDPVAALKEARRVARPGALFTAIEVDYRLLRPMQPAPAVDYFLARFCELFNCHGRCDTGSRLQDWLLEAGWVDVKSVPLPFDLAGDEGIGYLLAFMEPTLADMKALPGADSALLDQGLSDFKALAGRPGAGIRAEIHKAWARKNP